MSDSSDSKQEKRTSYETPIWFRVREKVEFDDSAIETRLTRIVPQDPNVTNMNTTGQIQFNLIPSSGQIYHLSSKFTSLIVRGKFAVGNSNIRAAPNSAANFGLNNVNSFKDADITFKNAFFGYFLVNWW